MMPTWNFKLYQQNCQKWYWKEEDYYCLHSEKLKDPHTNAKSYWSILKTLYNGKKIPLIPPILINNRLISNFKSCLCYKIITSHNASSEALVKNFFILQKSYVPFSRYSSFCIFNHPMLYQICNIIWALVHETGCIFEYIFWTTTH